MDEQRCLRAFRDLARRLEIDIRHTADGTSGLCTIRGSQVLFLDRDMPSDAQIRLFVREFRTLDLTGYHVVPLIRGLLGEDQDDHGWNSD